MMKLILSILPQNTPSHYTNRDELEIFRERILQSFYLIAVVIYICLLLFRLISSPLWQTIIIMPVIMAVLFLVVFSYLRNVAFNIRALVILLIIYFSGIGSIVLSGIGGMGKGILLILPLFTSILLGTAPAIFAIIVSSTSLLFFGMSFHSGLLPVPPFENDNNSLILANWYSSTALFTGISLFGGVSIMVLMREVFSGLRKQKQLRIELDREQNSLERKIAERTVNLEHRLNEIRTASTISRSLVAAENIEAMLQQVVDLLHDNFHLYYVGIFLVDEKGEVALLRAGSGEAGHKMLSANHRLAVGSSSMIGQATATKQPKIALDVGEEAVRFNNPLLPFTRSELALPLISRNNVLGAMSVQSSRSNDFDPDNILILQGIADGLASALDNAFLDEKLQQSLQEIRSLNRAYIQQEWSKMLQQRESLESTYVSKLNQSDVNTQQVEVPITLRDEIIGNIILDLESVALTPEEMTFVQSIAAQAALAMETVRLIEQTQRKAYQEQRLNQISASFSRSVNIEDILQITVNEIGHLPSVSEVLIELSSPASETLGFGAGTATKGVEK